MHQSFPRRQALNPFTPDHQIILDWLCKAEARVWDFSDVHDAVTANGTKITRTRVEQIFADLRHQRFGALLQLAGPDGTRLRIRHAYLPSDSPARKNYPAVAPAGADACDHPTLVAQKKALADDAAQKVKAAREESERLLERAEAYGAYRKRKLEARAKAADEKPSMASERFVSGYADPLTINAPAAPSVPSAAAQAAESAPPAAKYIKGTKK